MKRVSTNAVCLLVLFSIGFVIQASAKGKKYALFVGINDYENYNGLEGAVPDVEHMKALLESKFGFTAANDKKLTDHDATRANILAALTAIAAKATKGDLFVFHY